MKTKKVKKTESPADIDAQNVMTAEAAQNEPAEAAFDSNGNAVTGLTTQEVNARIEEGKINGDQNVRTKTVGEIFRTNIFTFFNILFIVIALILIFFIPQNSNGYTQFGFMVLVVINTTIGIVQELKAKKTIDKLSLISAPKVTAIRDGLKCDIAVSNIVLDEIVCLNSGCQICADGIVIDGMIEVNESQITGEPDAIQKKVGDEVMSGSYVLSGRAITKVTHIGKDNYATKISSGAKYLKKPSSEILRSLNAIIKFMATVIVPLGLALFLTKYFGQNYAPTPLAAKNIVQLLGWANDAKLNALVIETMGSLLGMIPSGLMALSSTVFCISVIRISRHKTLAQDLYCVETLARVDTLCLDKTGTITEGSMMVSELIPSGITLDEFKQILKNVQSSINDENATSNAINDFTLDIEQTETATSIVPFSSARKWSGAVFGDHAYVIGAAEFVFKNLNKEQKETIDGYSKEGYRVLALAKTNNLDGNELVRPKFLGYVLITDKIRKEAPDTLKFFDEQGVDIKIISGDNPVTVKAVAKRAGLIGADNYIDLSTLKTEQEVKDAATKYTIFGRVTPDQKLLLVKSLKAAGRTVAMTGDGVNDVLALKEADCSVAMASGSDAAKNVSSLVLLDSNFASMPKIVAEGRRSINNLERSAALYLVKTIYNFLLALIFMFIPSGLPFVPNDMTIIGSVTIGIPSFILALEPNKEVVKGRFIKKVLSNALPGSLTVVFSIMAVYVASLISPNSFTAEQLKNMYFIVTAFASFLFLAKVCYPFDWIRVILFISMVGVFLFIAFSARTKLSFIANMFKPPQNVTWAMWKIILIIFAIDIPLFTAIVLSLARLKNPKIISKISFKIDGKVEDDYNEQVDKAETKIEKREKFNKRIKNFFVKMSDDFKTLWQKIKEQAENDKAKRKARKVQAQKEKEKRLKEENTPREASNVETVNEQSQADTAETTADAVTEAAETADTISETAASSTQNENA